MDQIKLANMGYEPNMTIHRETARTYLLECFDAFEGIDVYVEKLAALFAIAELRGGSSTSASSSSPTASSSNSKGKGKGKGNLYATMLKIISAIGNGKTPALVDLASSLDIVTINNIKGAKTLELYLNSDQLKDLANGQKMTLMDLVNKAKAFGKGTTVSGIVYGLLNTDVVHDIIDKCEPLCPPK